jgi:hypothetical protein
VSSRIAVGGGRMSKTREGDAEATSRERGRRLLSRFTATRSVDCEISANATPRPVDPRYASAKNQAN